jgi:hypothetical protein
MPAKSPGAPMAAGAYFFSMRHLKISGTDAAVARSALGPRRGSTCPHPQPPRRRSRLSLFSKPGFSPGLLFCRRRPCLDARKRALGSGAVPGCLMGCLLVAVGATHPPPDVEANPKEERAGTNQRGDADGEDRLLHGDINLNGSHSVPVGAWPRSRGTALAAAALRT